MSTPRLTPEDRAELELARREALARLERLARSTANTQRRLSTYNALLGPLPS